MISRRGLAIIQHAAKIVKAAIPFWSHWTTDDAVPSTLLTFSRDDRDGRPPGS